MDLPEIYVTKEQAQRLAAILLDALVGAQIGSDLSPEGILYVVSVDVDSQDNRHYVIHPDGTWRETT